MTDGQAYSLLTQLACVGTIGKVLDRIKISFPDDYDESEQFLRLYDKYYDKKDRLVRHGNGYVDVAAFKKARLEQISRSVR